MCLHLSLLGVSSHWDISRNSILGVFHSLRSNEKYIFYERNNLNCKGLRIWDVCHNNEKEAAIHHAKISDAELTGRASLHNTAEASCSYKNKSSIISFFVFEIQFARYLMHLCLAVGDKSRKNCHFDFLRIFWVSFTFWVLFFV